MNITIQPGKLSGRVTVPPSKSVCHRLIIAASLADGQSVIGNVAYSEDIRATIGAMRALGADITADGPRLTVRGADLAASGSPLDIDCNESGSTIRFAIPLALAAGRRARFTGKPRLLARPLDAYFDICRQDGIAVDASADAVVFDGRLRGGRYELPGNVSSQYITGLLFALPLLAADSELHIRGTLESRGYVDLTLDALAAFGVSVENEQYQIFRVKGGQRYLPNNLQGNHPHDVWVEGDFSQAAFFLAADALGSGVSVDGLDPASRQGDRAILDIIGRMSGRIEWGADGCSASGGALSGLDVDVSQIPDLVPVLAVLACGASGVTRLLNAARLRIKESDRLATTTRELKRLGADIVEGPDSLTIRGTGTLSGGVCYAHNDHRIAMALAVAATIASGPVTVDGAECVKKSYAEFWDDYRRLGGVINEQ